MNNIFHYEEAKKTVLDFSQGNVKVFYFFFNIKNDSV